MHEHEELFDLPDVNDFSPIDDDADLAALAASLRERVKEVLAGRRDPEVVGERSQTEVANEVEKAVLAIEAIDAELAARADASKEYDTTLDSLGSRAGVEEELSASAEETKEEDEEEPEGEPSEEAAVDEAVAASGTIRETAKRYGPLPAARRHRLVVTESDDGRGLRVTAHASGLGAPYAPMAMLDRNEIGEFLTDVVRKNRVQPGQKAVLAHATYAFPTERILADGPDSHLTNSLRIREAINSGSTSLEALTASGGLCAPLPAIYELPGVETPARPVRASLPTFQAARGGAQLGATPTMGTYADAVGVVTDAENTAGGTGAVKACMRIECPDFAPVTVDSIYQCIEADNLAARAYPELMSRIADLVNAEQARLADSKLLQAIKVGSTNVTHGAETPGAAYWLLASIYTAASGIRSRNRMAPGSALQALLPAWTIDLLAQDISRGQFDRFQTRAQIEAILRNAGIIPTFYLDGPSTGDGQVFGAQSTGALVGFPDTLQWAIFPAGSWLHLDAGELQLGVVRDSSLNATNDFQVFSETWENVGFVGVESLWVTTNICANGQVALPGTAETCT